MPHRYHVQHVNEDADEGSDLMVPTGYGDRWCDNCGQYGTVYLTQMASGRYHDA